MTESNAYLAYGITVTTESLLYAVAAWPRLQGPFAFLDLVSLRKRQGTLAARHSRPTSQGVQTVPVEVWDVVRHKVVDLELRAAEVEHVESLMCEWCSEEGLLAETCTWLKLTERCEGTGWLEFSGLEDENKQQAARNLVAAFRLALPTHVPIRHLQPGENLPMWPYCDPNTATLISVPAPRTAGNDAFALRASCGGDVEDDGQFVVDVSFEVPAGAELRFRRLVSTMHLEPVDISDGVIVNDGTSAAQGVKDFRLGQRRFDRIPLEELRPRWKLVTMAQTVW
ncbi:hypothetical protein JCM9279_002449 [Rhodotorula babjevae]